MNIEEKYQAIKTAMVKKTREDKTEFYCFSDTAPEDLQDLYLEHYEVRDIDYETFSSACDWLSDQELSDIQKEDFEIEGDFASPYNSDRLSYLNVWNDNEVAEIFKDFSCEDISMACAIWYDEQVRNSINIIRDYILK